MFRVSLSVWEISTKEWESLHTLPSHLPNLVTFPTALGSLTVTASVGVDKERREDVLILI